MLEGCWEGVGRVLGGCWDSYTHILDSRIYISIFKKTKYVVFSPSAKNPPPCKIARLFLNLLF